MVTRKRREDGAAALEFGLVLPILLVIVTGMAPLVKAGYEYMVLQRAVSHGVRFASRADVNPRSDGGTLTRRPSPGEVKSFVVNAAQPLNIAPGNVTVSPNPREALPGEQIEITASHTISFGVIGDIANSVSQVLFGGGAYLSDKQVTVSARGREE
jgi:Flp pilus assembly protein TadG